MLLIGCYIVCVIGLPGWSLSVGDSQVPAYLECSNRYSRKDVGEVVMIMMMMM